LGRSATGKKKKIQHIQPYTQPYKEPKVGRNIQADSTVIFITAHICNHTLYDTHIEIVPWLRTAVAGT